MSIRLQDTGSENMGQTITGATPGGDTLPFNIAGTVPVATGTGWTMAAPQPNFVVSALGTLATGTTTLLCGQANFFTFTCFGGTMTLAFGSMALGQQITIVITGAGSAAITWPSTMTWVGVGSASDGVHSAPVVTSLTTVVTIVCTAVGASPTFVGTYITG